jgi:hypothetical protein
MALHLRTTLPQLRDGATLDQGEENNEMEGHGEMGDSEPEERVKQRETSVLGYQRCR